MLSSWPTGRRIATSALVCLGVAVLIVTALNGLATTYPMRLFQGLLAAVGALSLLAMALGFLITRLAGWSTPADEADFEALDDLPDLLVRALRHVAVVVSDDGRRHRAYGLYQGDGVARDDHPDRIVIFRDTLLRDFGHDPNALREQVTRTVRHELAHHLGADELGVRELGL